MRVVCYYFTAIIIGPLNYYARDGLLSGRQLCIVRLNVPIVASSLMDGGQSHDLRRKKNVLRRYSLPGEKFSGVFFSQTMADRMSMYELDRMR